LNNLGKLIGGLGGLLVLGPVGGLVGVILGHQFDRGASEAAARLRRHGLGSENTGRVGQQFFDATFAVMGHIAKADGRVSESEIRAARSLMHQMQLRPEQIKRAIDQFNDGKRRDYALDDALSRLRRECGRRHDLCRAFVEIQLRAALAEGQIHQEVRRLLWHVAQTLGISRVEFAQIEAMARAHQAFAGGQRVPERREALQQAYKVLGVEAATSDAEIKRAYRRLMNQHHPDKLVARGLPESMTSVAEEKTREIRSAYETIKAVRQIK
jgi:DnaJ like chaperone protein